MDLTPLFKQCCDIVEEEAVSVEKRSKSSSGAVNSSRLTKYNEDFVRTCYDLQSQVKSLKSHLVKFRPSYLISRTEKMAFSSSHLSEEEKTQFEEWSQNELGQMKMILAQLDSKKTLIPQQNKYILFHDAGEEAKVVAYNKFRSSVVASLKLYLEEAKDILMEMVNKRQDLQNQLAKNTLNIHSNDTTIFQKAETLKLESQLDTWDEQPVQQVQSQQQLQLLETENEELLESKNQDLQATNHIVSTMLELSKMVDSISSELSTQNLRLETIMDNTEDTLSDLRLGNTQLKKAHERNKTTGRFFVYVIVALALFILLVDYIVG